MRKKNSCCTGVLRLLPSFILLASLLVLPKAQGAVGDTFTLDTLKYTVLTEEPASQTGTVSVASATPTHTGGHNEIPALVANGGIDYSVTSIDEFAFYNCSNLTGIVIPDSVTSIGERAFYGCSSLTGVVIPDSVTSIGNAAFEDCSGLKSITIPDSVTSIGVGAFSGCSNLTEIVVGNENHDYSSLDGVLFDEAQTTLIQCPGGKSGAYTIPDTVTSIGNGAFSYCSGLTSITIPDGVISIGARAFYGCSRLTSITIPDGVISIGARAFYGCSRLTSIIIPDSVTYIGEYAFGGCFELTSIAIPDGVTKIREGTFLFCSGLTNIIIPDRVTSIGERAFDSCDSLVNAIIGNGVTSIGSRAFYGCYSLTGVYFRGDAPLIPEDEYAFYEPSIIYCAPETIRWTYPWSGRPVYLWRFPIIIEQPQSQAVVEGDSVTFSVVAAGPNFLCYQWYKDDIPLDGATYASGTIVSVGAEDLGNYTVVVSDELGEVTSDVAVLSYLEPPTITAPPVNLTVDAWTQAVFQVEALDADSYQWYKNDTPISGATNVLYTIESAKGTDVGTYKVVVANRAGIATSSATLTLTQPYRATGTVQVVNGYVVGLTVTDGGWGYTRETNIRIIDETGSGATGHCVVENGVVTQIIIDSNGSNYSEEATVLIGSPFSNSSLRIGVSEVEVEMSLALGMEYQLWSSADCINWEKVGETFIAEEEEMTFFFKIADYGRFFKLQEIY